MVTMWLVGVTDCDRKASTNCLKKRVDWVANGIAMSYAAAIVMQYVDCLMKRKSVRKSGQKGDCNVVAGCNERR